MSRAGPGDPGISPAAQRPHLGAALRQRHLAAAPGAAPTARGVWARPAGTAFVRPNRAGTVAAKPTAPVQKRKKERKEERKREGRERKRKGEKEEGRKTDRQTGCLKPQQLTQFWIPAVGESRAPGSWASPGGVLPRWRGASSPASQKSPDSSCGLHPHGLITGRSPHLPRPWHQGFYFNTVMGGGASQTMGV